MAVVYEIVLARKFSMYSLKPAYLLLMSMLLSSCFLQDSFVRAKEGDEFEGAVWEIEMSKKKSGSKKYVGRYRIADDVVFQKEKPADKEFSRKVGKNFPKDAKSTRMEVEDFLIFEKQEREQKRIKGTAKIRKDENGEWSGVFTDSEGANWDFSCTRIKE